MLMRMQIPTADDVLLPEPLKKIQKIKNVPKKNLLMQKIK